jgi:hypothetical protein
MGIKNIADRLPMPAYGTTHQFAGSRVQEMKKNRTTGSR